MDSTRDKRNSDWKNSQLTVAVRIRPMTTAEIEAGSTVIAQAIDDNIVVLLDPMEDPDDILRANRSREKHYAFDRCFGELASQEEIYLQTTKCLIQSVIQGYNATVFAYGATGAGKTYTMLGTDNEPGIMARALNDLFDAMDARSEDSVYKVTMSYLEIYNENIRDLLNPSSGFLELREDASGNVQVAGISEVSTVSTEEVMSLLMEGNKERTQEPTAANKTSSRSHAVLQVTVKERDRIRTTSQKVRIGKLFMIDLAGSERASQTKNRGKRMIEGAHINRSLLALGNCINALVEGGKYVNYRDSKLTRILKDALGGNCKTVMIANISPASILFEESRNTLMYADRAKNIKMKIKQNLTSVTHHMVQYTNIITELRQEIVRLQKKIADKNRLKESSPQTHEARSEESMHSRDEMDRLRQQLMANFQEQMGIRQNMMEVENRKWEVAVLINRQMAIITEWEQERLRSKEINKEMDNRYKERNQEKETDADSTTSESPEPEDIVNAREEIAVLVGRKNKLVTAQKELEGRLEEVRTNANTLEEVLPKKITSEEQGEILSMLCKVHELEIENTELKSQALIHKHTTEQKETLIRRYEKHRLLSDRIIQEQRSLINKHGIFRPQQLEDWYDQYTSAVFDEMSIISTNPNLQNIRDIKATSMLNLRTLKALQEGSDDTLPEKESMDIKARTKKPTHVPEDSSNQPRVFNPSPRAHQLRQKSEFGSLPKIKVQTSSPLVATMTPPVTKHESLETLNDHGKHPQSPGSTLMKARSLHDLEVGDSDPDLVANNRKEIIQRTKKIAAIAAQKRNSQKQFEKLGSRPEKMNLHEKTIVSLRSVYEVSEPDTDREYLTMSRLSKHNSMHNAGHNDPNNDDNMSIVTIDRRSELTDTYSNINVRHSRHKNMGGGSIKRPTEKQLAEKRRRRGLGYESSGHVMYMPSKGGHNRAYPSVDAHHRGHGKKIVPRATATHAGPDTHPTGKVKYPIVHHAGEQDTTILGSRSTPTNINAVHQVGVDRGKGQSLQKRTRGVANNDMSNHSTPQLLGGKQPVGKRQQPTYPVYQRKNQLSVSGFGVTRNQRIGYRKM
ncbi:kinesin-like protein KIF19 [Acanthaster planci]|uniref:Kinesin-like protein KIF19 n=1 Tax=Acanthaster planci TaxID=133434 RepID=A0A8B7YM16_ACAPL|nr:kinesin-like protein KIF19 [Acanthaster planci]